MKYSMFLRRVVSCCLVFSLVFASAVPAQAVTTEDVTRPFAVAVDWFTLFWHTLSHSDFLTWFDHSEDDPGSLMFYYIYSPLNCPDSPVKDEGNSKFGFHDFGRHVDGETWVEYLGQEMEIFISLFGGEASCRYCGMSFEEYAEAVAAERALWESQYNSVVADVPFSLPDTDHDEMASWVDLGNLTNFSIEPNYADYTIGKYLYYTSYPNYNYYYAPFYNNSFTWSSDSFFVSESGSYRIYLPEVLFSSIGSQSSKSFSYQRLVDGSWVTVSSWSFKPAKVDFDGLDVYSFGPSVKSVSLAGGFEYRVICIISDGSFYSNRESGRYVGLSGFMSFSNLVVESVDSLGSIFDPGNSDQTSDDKYSADSRPSGIVDVIQQYNTNNTFVDNSVTNYYIGSFDADDNLTGYYPMDIYDEETLKFTEPVTGAQYQTTGWKYDYASRCYTLDLEPGTFALGDYDILQIKLTYGDDAVTIQYYNELGDLVETDDYQYIMVAKDQCTLNGHSYTVETTKEPSCTAAGERLYTCSVCGDQKVDVIPMLEHIGVYSVFQEATCTASGVGVMACSRCGKQITDDIPALGHDWISVEDVETTFALPDGTSCPACSSADFAVELDRINEVYSCLCASCGQIWTADAHVQHGYTKYECSRCGKVKTESHSQEDGLFASVGNLIADGIVWCTEKLTQLVTSLTGIVDTFTGYLDSLSSTGGAFPSFLALLFTALPDELTSLIWLSLVGLVALLVWKKWLS